MKKKKTEDTVMCGPDDWESVARTFGWKDVDIVPLHSILSMGTHENLSFEVGRTKIAVRETQKLTFSGTGRDGQVHSHTLRRSGGMLWRRSMEFSSMVATATARDVPAVHVEPPPRVAERVLCGCPIRHGKLWMHEGDCPVAERRRLERIEAEIRMLEGEDESATTSTTASMSPRVKKQKAKERFQAAQIKLL